MNISAIKLPIAIKNYTNMSKVPSFKCAECTDSFERTTAKSEKNENEAIQWIRETDFVNKKLVNIFSNAENILGEGFTHSVYGIPDSDDYVLRVRKSCIPKDEIKGFNIKDIEDKNLKINIGQPIAEIQFATDVFPVGGRVEVLKKQTGEPLGVKPPSAIYVEETGQLKENELPYGDISRKEDYQRTIHKVAQMPVESYEKFLDDITAAAKTGYRFDYYNSNNILVDADSQSLNLIDMDKGSSHNVDYGSVLYALTNAEYFGTFTSKYEQPVMSEERIMNVVDDTITIIDKYIQAMKNKGIKFDKENSSMSFFKLLGSMPCQFYLRTFDMREQWAKLEQMGVV